MNIAERLEPLKQFNRKNNNGNDDDDSPPPPPNFGRPPYYSPSPSKDDSDIEGDLNLTQKFLLGDRPQKEKMAVAVGENIAVGVGERKLDFQKILAKHFQRLAIFLIIKKLILMTVMK